MKKNSQAFADPFVALLILSVSLMGSVGIGMVWMRHQISTTANRSQALVVQRTEIERLITEKSAEVASAQRPDLLRNLNEQHRLALVPMSDVPVFTESSETAVRGLVQRASFELMEPVPAVTIRIARN
ncbi:MAG: hypothetical protein V4773_30735 [Verrucomicrobiota bacterium]